MTKAQAGPRTRRFAPYAVLGLVAVAVALASYVVANRQVIVERPALGGPPSSNPRPKARRHPTLKLVGRAAPAFSARDLQGQAVGTTALRGRVVVLNMWATWCQPCREELPRVERDIWQRFRPDVAVVAVAEHEDAAKVRAFNQRANLTFALVPDPKGSVGHLYSGNAIPRTYVIDRSGVVVHEAIGYDEKSFGEVIAAVQRAVARR